MVMSMDGVVAFDERTDIRPFSSEEDHRFFVNGAGSCDALIMGRFSYRGFASKRKYLLTHDPSRIVFDDNTIVLSGDVVGIYERIAADGNQRTALLGGPRTNVAFLREGLVDEIWLTVEPVILGDGQHFAFGDLYSRWLLRDSIRLNEQGTVVHHYVREGDSLSNEKNRWNDILKNPDFLDNAERLEVTEKERIFCRHGLVHLMNTARIMQIMNLEEGHMIPKDLIYAAGLLHDIGRLKQYEDGTPHELAAGPIADGIMAQCGYTKAERETVLFAISVHRDFAHAKGDMKQRLAGLLYRADKSGRMCFRCLAREKCNWPAEQKNKVLLN